MSCCRPYSIHVRAHVMSSWSCESRVCDALCVQTKSNFLRIVLRYRKCARNNLGLVSIAPTLGICIRIIFTSRLPALKVCKMKDAVHVCSWLSSFDWCNHDKTRDFEREKTAILEELKHLLLSRCYFIIGIVDHIASAYITKIYCGGPMTRSQKLGLAWDLRGACSPDVH